MPFSFLRVTLNEQKNAIVDKFHLNFFLRKCANCDFLLQSTKKILVAQIILNENSKKDVFYNESYFLY